MYKLKKAMAVMTSAVLCLSCVPMTSHSAQVSAAAFDEEISVSGGVSEEVKIPADSGEPGEEEIPACGEESGEEEIPAGDVVSEGEIPACEGTEEDVLVDGETAANDKAAMEEVNETDAEEEARASTDETIICDISKGSVTIGETEDVKKNSDKITYTDGNGELHEGVEISSRTHIVITGTTDRNTVRVHDYDDAPLDITFRDLTIDVTQIPAEPAGYASTCAVYFGGESASWPQGRVNLTLEGENTIRSLDYAGIAVPVGETLLIRGEGSLDVSSAKGNAGTGAPAIGSTVATNSPPPYIVNEKLDTSFGTIIINGGTIRATSHSAAIGGGQGCVTGTIVINGGDITAIAGEASSAGIGCGQDSAIGSILITGGTIKAEGSNSGPGIGGGGMHTDSGIITIKGGDITATGGNYAPGIGGSGMNDSHGHATQIHIYGGTIKAYGGKYASGIGSGGTAGLADDILISGGTVYAYGGAGSVTTGDHRSRVIGEDGKMSMVVDGTSTGISAAGAGIGNGGAVFSIVNYTSGVNAGKTIPGGTAQFGGSVKVTGGTVYAYSGTIPDEEAAKITDTGYIYYEAEAIGNGGYVDGNVTEDNPYIKNDRVFTGGSVYENDVLTYSENSPSPQPSVSQAPAVGSRLNDAKTKTIYRVTKTKSTVEFAGTYKNVLSLTIPSTVKIGGITYKVTSVGKNALKGNRKLQTAVIAGNVTKIRRNAFRGCTALTTVKIGANITKIGKKAFYNCKKLQKVTISSQKLTADKTGVKAFKKAGKSNYRKLKVLVSSSKRKSYKTILQEKGLSPKASVKAN